MSTWTCVRPSISVPCRRGGFPINTGVQQKVSSQRVQTLFARLENHICEPDFDIIGTIRPILTAQKGVKLHSRL
jgi:hypothetical protein